jgi:nicotinamide mononucleotide adenylyltransferase
MSGFGSAEILDLIDSRHRKLVAATLISREDILQLKGSIAFYAGSFDPPHDGHNAVMEAALISVADHLVVSVHSHNLASKPGSHAELHRRMTWVAFVLDGSPLRSVMHLAPPNVLDGIQNPQFDEIAYRLSDRGATPWVVMGQDAVKPTYRHEMRHLSHFIVDRPPYENRSNAILTGPVVRVESQTEPLYRALKRDPRLVAKLYDARVGGFHYVMSSRKKRFLLKPSRAAILFSERIEGQNFTSFEVPAYAAFDSSANRWSPFSPSVHWSLFKAPVRVEADDLGYFHLSRV